MTFPAPFTVGLHKFSQGADDGYGNPNAPIFTPPLDEPGVPYRVFGWSGLTSHVSAGEMVSERRRVTKSKQLFAPDSFPGAAWDRVDIADGQYEILGFDDDHDHGPWWNPQMKMYAIQEVLG